jgi:predicted phosphoribosyltransferase
MRVTFRDRREAGELLAEKLVKYERQRDVLVLGLPRGGMPVAAEVADRLGLPLDVFVVRKLGVPGHEELAMGAVATGGFRVMNEMVVRQLRISPVALEAVVKKELKELERRERSYRNARKPVQVQGKTVILVDDGVATGSSVMAAVKGLRSHGVGKIVVAVPTVAPSTLPDLEARADEVVWVIAPEDFMAVGQWYDDFSQTSDEEVRQIMDVRDK